MNLLKRIEASLLDGQYGHPTGIVGRMLGEQMVRQHVPETIWTISLLDLKPEDHIEEQVIPTMKQLGFTLAYIKQGPASRQFKTTAVIGVK